MSWTWFLGVETQPFTLLVIVVVPCHDISCSRRASMLTCSLDLCKIILPLLKSEGLSTTVVTNVPGSVAGNMYVSFAISLPAFKESADTFELFMINAVDLTTFGLFSRAFIRCLTMLSMSRPTNSSELITIFWLYNGWGRFNVLFGYFDLTFARFVMVFEVVVVVVVVMVVVVVLWVALACVSFSSTAKRTERKGKRQINGLISQKKRRF